MTFPLPIGTHIHYTGDAANASGEGWIVEIGVPTCWMKDHCVIILADGRRFNAISATLIGATGRFRVKPCDPSSSEHIAEVLRQDEARRFAKEQAETLKKTERLRLIALGKDIARQLIPDTAKALLVAFHNEDISDPMSDYYGHRTTDRVVLATSRHTRDLFPEMRKAAGRFAETRHLKENGVEHREKWSMGGGFYLSAGMGRHANGWLIQKVCRSSADMEWPSDIFQSLAIRHALDHEIT
jgi:hypothetical protein